MKNNSQRHENISPEEKLRALLREKLSLTEKIAAAEQLRAEGESLETILKVYPEYSETLRRKRAAG